MTGFNYPDFFSSRVSVFTGFLREYAGRPNISYLEVGVLEGRSLVWMAEHVVQHPTSRIVGIDNFCEYPLPYKETLYSNIEQLPNIHNIEILQGDSKDILPTLSSSSFDIIYIDAGHTGRNILTDLVFAWRLLKNGGILFVDDYLAEKTVSYYTRRRKLPANLKPKAAIDEFVRCFLNEIRILHSGYLVALRKSVPISIRDVNEHLLTVFDEFEYNWQTSEVKTEGGSARLNNWRDAIFAATYKVFLLSPLRFFGRQRSYRMMKAIMRMAVRTAE